MVTREDIERAAALAKLSLKGRDVDGLVNDFSAILDFAAIVSEVQVGQGTASVPEHSKLREDVVLDSLPNEKVLQNAGVHRDGFFVARKKMEEEENDEQHQ